MTESNAVVLCTIFLCSSIITGGLRYFCCSHLWSIWICSVVCVNLLQNRQEALLMVAEDERKLSELKPETK